MANIVLIYAKQLIASCPFIPMDRIDWIKSVLINIEKRMDRIAPTYDEDWSKISPTHNKLIEQFLGLLPADPLVLDAACGTGKYWGLLLDNGVSIHGIDHSRKMLEVAQSKFPRVQTSKMRLQDIDFVDKFDGIICMDAMEYIFPEHWPIVVKKFARALKSDGVTYLTVEIPDEKTLRDSYHKNLNANLPVRLGEDYEDGGYHYYPGRDLVRGWLSEYFDIKHAERGDYYHHYILLKKA